MSVEIFEIGGCVRDEILGVPSKDIDYTCVANSFEEMVKFIEDNGLKIVVSTPEFSTVRALAPKSGFRGHQGGLDFVWAREDGPYSDGRRPDWTKPADLQTDQKRRDFTMNSIAKAEDGTLIDPFGGYADIEKKLIRAVGNPLDRLTEDALRAVRALRFAVTKHFFIDQRLAMAMQHGLVLSQFTNGAISEERVQQELSKMFRYDSVRSMKLLVKFNRLTDALFDGNVSLDATLKTKGRG